MPVPAITWPPPVCPDLRCAGGGCTMAPSPRAPKSHAAITQSPPAGGGCAMAVRDLGALFLTVDIKDTTEYEPGRNKNCPISVMFAH